MKTFFQFVFSKLFAKQFLLALIIAAVLFIVTVISLRIYTHHGHTVQVPDIKGYNEIQLARIVSEAELRYEIIDSVYTEEVLPGTVFDQIPPAGSFVKENRKLFLVLNAKQGERVALPSLKNVSLRQAKVMITQTGLKVGNVIYVSSEYKDLVVNQLVGDTIATPGTMVPKFTTIDLYVGRGLSASKTAVPYLRGMYLIDALKQVEKINLNKGTIIKDTSIRVESLMDSAIVWKQYPQPHVNASLGKAVDLWLTMDTAVVYAADSTLRFR